ncbi:uracil-DNA glycosylase [Magnetospirillum molischianum]|uniref:Type-4 uracil-DNA glycosylase n=1 Tax=Magnetospirillum molischianum DSM 120 TaxID=1150626 RepID=H8FN35_MAGML|nr:uracil-DNA glycosylase [Magnetospirillum molischianum]CCG39773.1 Uracil-DNA glycosylase [Magnetospirillum molischianum DSM 120]
MSLLGEEAGPSGRLHPFDLLRWYLDVGVDECIGELAIDRYSVPPPVPRPVAAAVPASPSSSSPRRAVVGREADGAGASGTATQIAAACTSLTELHRALEAFEGLPLKQAATSTVFADGSAQPRLMCIGEAPGHEEDRQGVPFIGASGKLLDRMLKSIGLDRSEVYITNVVPWRPPANRKPTQDEVAVCLPFVIRHIELVDPPLLLLLGGAAASALLARSEGINRLRGQWFEVGSPGLQRPVPTLATFHPAYLLRTPEAKREAWRDLLLLSKKL